MALFTSDRTGFSQASMVTMATALISPFSLAVLWVGTAAPRSLFVGYFIFTSLSQPTIEYRLLCKQTHRRIFERFGARRALRYSTMVYALSLGSTGAFLQWCSRRVASNDGTSTSIHSISQCWIVFILLPRVLSFSCCAHNTGRF